MRADRNPYRASSTSGHPVDAVIPTWRWALSILFRASAAIVMAAPFVAFVFDPEDHNLNAVLMDLPGVVKALLCCFGLAGLLAFVGRKIGAKGRGSKTEE